MRHAKEAGPAELEGITRAFQGARRRILFLDYDGTLAPFTIHPEDASPTAELLHLLGGLGALEATDVVVISGRGREILKRWLGRRPIHLVAEHGAWIRRKGEEWRLIKPLPSGWKDWVRPIMRSAAEGLSGVFVEEKEFSVVWHYRGADPARVMERKPALLDALLERAGASGLEVLEGNKIVEVRNAGADKGMVAGEFLAQGEYDFILAIGDDTTDEDLFKALPPAAYSIRVGKGQTAARLHVAGTPEVAALLQKLRD